jgi:uncharacterized protein (DUF885 family)
MVASVVLWIFLAPSAGANGGTSDMHPEPSSTSFSRLAEEFMKASLALSPVSASQAGYHRHTEAGGRVRDLDAEIDDLSPAGVAAQRRFYASWGERFRREVGPGSLAAQDAADFQLIDDQIALNMLEFDGIQSFKHNPTGVVELIGNALFLPLTQEYAPKGVRLGHVLSRLGELPRALSQAKQSLVDSDPIFVTVAREENEGNLDLVEATLAQEIPQGSALRSRYDKVAPAALAALRDFSKWLEELGHRPSSRSWRLGKDLYDQKFRYIMETNVTPEEVLSDAEAEFKAVRAEMLELATPLHKTMYPDHTDHSDAPLPEREDRIVGEVLAAIAADHPRRDALLEAVGRDLEGIRSFIRDKRIVSLNDRDNLKVIPTPLFMRGIYSVAGFHSAPPLDPRSEAQYWVTPIDSKMDEQLAESKLREYNNWTLKWLTIHEALPGHYIQAEHANNVDPESRRLIRNVFANGPYVEGWAEYIAQVMMDEGFLGNDPRFRLSMRKIRLRVLSNAILDVRLHTLGMTDELAMDLIAKQAFQTQAEAEGKLRRAKLSSVQLPTYYVGLRDFLALRRDYEKAKGKAFSLLEFHDRVLDQGPLPIQQLRKILLGEALGAR